MDSQPLAYMNPQFLESGDARPIRILAEYLEPHRRFRAARIRDTVTFFGSARIRSREAAERQLHAAMEGDLMNGQSKDEAIAAADRALEWSAYYEDARELANRLTAWSQTLPGPCHRFVVCSGGGPGIMEAPNRGAHEAGGRSVGLNIRLPAEQGANAYISNHLHFEFHYFFMRKFWFAYLGKAIVVFPGGFGTLDELFEILTLIQTGKIRKKMPIVVYGKSFWDDIIDFDKLAYYGMISRSDLNL